MRSEHATHFELGNDEILREVRNSDGAILREVPGAQAIDWALDFAEMSERIEAMMRKGDKEITRKYGRGVQYNRYGDLLLGEDYT
jgi:hypothetical protein